ncbi:MULTISPECIES: hypothetical protein [unclassified Pseudoalteromonas]|uniref:hypothetical protein n=1 Tax=unclassified Pseudoalteromonas TaxID=194690 RepID=UPI000AEF20DF|nr:MULTISPECIES: hypothetical protein [unclassified Pseudoalteromonas]
MNKLNKPPWNKGKIIGQQKTNTPVQFEITKGTRESIQLWINRAKLKPNDYLF